jgi:hypothetical protein
MLSDESDEGVQAAIAGELRLHDSSVRRTRAETEALLHPDFLEFGASGRRWNRREIIEAMAADPAVEREPVAVTTPSELTAIRLGDDIVLVTYLSENHDRRSNRSSIWRKTSAGWQVYFHQGTIIPVE